MTRNLEAGLIAATRDIEEALAKLGIQGVIVGGIAVSLLAAPRHTGDVDVIVLYDVATAGDLLAALEAQGFRARFEGMAEFAVQARLVTVTHEPTGTVVDIMLGCMPFEEELIRRASLYQTANISVRLPSPEDLIILKAIANRPKDQEDIRRISEAYPSLDRARIRRWVEEYAELLETPGLWQEIEILLAP